MSHELKIKVSDAWFGQKRFSVGSVTHVFLTKDKLVYKRLLKSSVLKSQFQLGGSLEVWAKYHIKN